MVDRAELHGTASGWRGRGVWPRCVCGFDPRNNAALHQHYATYGFREVDMQGTLTRRTIPNLADPASVERWLKE